MTDFIIKQLPYELSNQAGLALIGKYLKRININSLVDPTFSVRSGIANSDILKSYLGLLCLGKNDFDAIEGQRKDAFFARALDLRAVPSSPTLRQRMDTHAASWFDLADEINAAVLGMKISGKPMDFGVLPCGYMPLDVDTFAMDNSGTVKEHVGRTYAGVDGYCPLAAYLGTQGFCLELALRPGTQHSASETEYNIERVLPMAVRLTSSRSGAGDTAIPLLFRADSGFDSAKLMCAIGKQALALKREIAFIIKWNPRSTPVETMAKNRAADTSTTWTQVRAGKRQCLWADGVELRHGDDVLAARRVYRLTERTIDKKGQQMLLPEYVLEGWSTTLPNTFTPEKIIALYADHGTHEQFHSEFKTDMDLSRLPSGKFDTNYLVCALAAVAMNLLRLVGQHTLHEPDAPVRHTAQRRRIRTVMQELMFKAARMVHHARQWVLGLGANDTAFAVFERHWCELDTA
jgi:Transposase DDE domain group 1